MELKNFTEPEIRAELSRQELIVVWLEDQVGTIIVSKNAPTVPVKKHADKVFRTLTSGSVPDGLYYIKAKPSHRSLSVPMSWAFVKGRLSERSAQLTVVQPGADVPAMNWQQILSLQGDYGRVTSEANFYKQQWQTSAARCEDLQQIIDDLRSELHEKSMGEKAEPAAPGFFTPELITAALPLLGEFFKRSEPTAAPAPAPDPEFNKLKMQQAALIQAVNKLSVTLQDMRSHGQPDLSGLAEDERELYQAMYAQDPTGATWQAYQNGKNEA